MVKEKVLRYRFLSSGTIEEKVYQRQLAKQALTSVVDGRGSGLEQMSMTTEDLAVVFVGRGMSERHAQKVRLHADVQTSIEKLKKEEDDEPKQHFKRGRCNWW